MFNRVSDLRWVAAAALMVCAGYAQATITVYTSQASFLAAVSAAATDTFDDLTSPPAAISSPLLRSVGAYTYTASSPGGLFSAGSVSDIWLSNNTASDHITLASFTGGVVGAGADFFDSNANGLNRLLAGTVTVSATDSSGTVSHTLTNPTPTTFLGFVSNTQLWSVTVGAANTSRFPRQIAWPTVNNLTLAAAVPEPETYMMMLGGLAALSFIARRRRKVD